MSVSLTVREAGGTAGDLFPLRISVTHTRFDYFDVQLLLETTGSDDRSRSALTFGGRCR